MTVDVYQIFYSEATRKENDEGFLPLDNLANERADWREYWPIRQFLLSAALDENGRYGFLSPKFKSKTGLNAQHVYDFVAQSEADVYIFSPYFDQSAFYMNIVEHAGAQHQNIKPTLEKCFHLLNPAVNIGAMYMDSSQTVFCNYFVAKKSFWDAWLKYCETIFVLAESNDSELAKQLNAATNHGVAHAPVKTFVIERVASYLLATRTDLKVAVYNPMNLPYSPSVFSRFKMELCQLDALKAAYRHNPFPQYLEIFNRIRSHIIGTLQSGR